MIAEKTVSSRAALEISQELSSFFQEVQVSSGIADIIANGFVFEVKKQFNIETDENGNIVDIDDGNALLQAQIYNKSSFVLALAETEDSDHIFLVPPLLHQLIEERAPGLIKTTKSGKPYFICKNDENCKNFFLALADIAVTYQLETLRRILADPLEINSLIRTIAGNVESLPPDYLIFESLAKNLLGQDYSEIQTAKRKTDFLIFPYIGTRENSPLQERVSQWEKALMAALIKVNDETLIEIERQIFEWFSKLLLSKTSDVEDMLEKAGAEIDNMFVKMLPEKSEEINVQPILQNAENNHEKIIRIVNGLRTLQYMVILSRYQKILSSNRNMPRNADSKDLIRTSKRVIMAQLLEAIRYYASMQEHLIPLTDLMMLEMDTAYAKNFISRYAAVLNYFNGKEIIEDWVNEILTTEGRKYSAIHRQIAQIIASDEPESAQEIKNTKVFNMLSDILTGMFFAQTAVADGNKNIEIAEGNMLFKATITERESDFMHITIHLPPTSIKKYEKLINSLDIDASIDGQTIFMHIPQNKMLDVFEKVVNSSVRRKDILASLILYGILYQNDPLIRDIFNSAMQQISRVTQHVYLKPNLPEEIVLISNKTKQYLQSDNAQQEIKDILSHIVHKEFTIQTGRKTTIASIADPGTRNAVADMLLRQIGIATSNKKNANLVKEMRNIIGLLGNGQREEAIEKVINSVYHETRLAFANLLITSIADKALRQYAKDGIRHLSMWVVDVLGSNLMNYLESSETSLLEMMMQISRRLSPEEKQIFLLPVFSGGIESHKREEYLSRTQNRDAYRSNPLVYLTSHALIDVYNNPAISDDLLRQSLRKLISVFIKHMRIIYANARSEEPTTNTAMMLSQFTFAVGYSAFYGDNKAVQKAQIILDEIQELLRWMRKEIDNEKSLIDAHSLNVVARDIRTGMQFAQLQIQLKLSLTGENNQINTNIDLTKDEQLAALYSMMLIADDQAQQHFTKLLEAYNITDADKIIDKVLTVLEDPEKGAYIRSFIAQTLAGKKDKTAEDILAAYGKFLVSTEGQKLVKDLLRDIQSGKSWDVIADKMKTSMVEHLIKENEKLNKENEKLREEIDRIKEWSQVCALAMPYANGELRSRLIQWIQQPPTPQEFVKYSAGYINNPDGFRQQLEILALEGNSVAQDLKKLMSDITIVLIPNQEQKISSKLQAIYELDNVLLEDIKINYHQTAALIIGDTLRKIEEIAAVDDTDKGIAILINGILNSQNKSLIKKLNNNPAYVNPLLTLLENNQYVIKQNGKYYVKSTGHQLEKILATQLYNPAVLSTEREEQLNDLIQQAHAKSKQETKEIHELLKQALIDYAMHILETEKVTGRYDISDELKIMAAYLIVRNASDKTIWKQTPKLLKSEFGITDEQFNMLQQKAIKYLNEHHPTKIFDKYGFSDMRQVNEDGIDIDGIIYRQ